MSHKKDKKDVLNGSAKTSAKKNIPVKVTFHYAINHLSIPKSNTARAELDKLVGYTRGAYKKEQIEQRIHESNIPVVADVNTTKRYRPVDVNVLPCVTHPYSKNRWCSFTTCKQLLWKAKKVDGSDLNKQPADNAPKKGTGSGLPVQGQGEQAMERNLGTAKAHVYLSDNTGPDPQEIISSGGFDRESYSEMLLRNELMITRSDLKKHLGNPQSEMTSTTGLVSMQSAPKAG